MGSRPCVALWLLSQAESRRFGSPWPRRPEPVVYIPRTQLRSGSVAAKGLLSSCTGRPTESTQPGADALAPLRCHRMSGSAAALGDLSDLADGQRRALHATHPFPPGPRRVQELDPGVARPATSTTSNLARGPRSPNPSAHSPKGAAATGGVARRPVGEWWHGSLRRRGRCRGSRQVDAAAARWTRAAGSWRKNARRTS